MKKPLQNDRNFSKIFIYMFKKSENFFKSRGLQVNVVFKSRGLQVTWSSSHVVSRDFAFRKLFKTKIE